MAGINYARLQATAARLIQENGVAAQIQGPASGADPYDPDSTGTTPDPLPCFAVETEYSAYEQQNTLIASDDKKMLVTIAAALPVPTNADKLIVGGVTMEIKNVKRIKPGPLVIMYEIQARG